MVSTSGVVSCVVSFGISHGVREVAVWKGAVTMMNDERWVELQQAEDMAYFKADLCCYSPESYSLDEKKEICNNMISTSKAVLDAMRADFEQLPPGARSKLLGMLCQSGVETPEWWWDVLVGEGDPLYRELEAI